MDILGKLIVFTEGHQVGKPEEEGFKAWLGFNTTISHKNEDGTYNNVSMEVRFVGEMNAKAQKLAPDTMYHLNVTKGWLDVRTYTNKAGELKKIVYIAISEATTEGKGKKIKKPQAVNNDNLPF